MHRIVTQAHMQVMQLLRLVSSDSIQWLPSVSQHVNRHELASVSMNDNGYRVCAHLPGLVGHHGVLPANYQVQLQKNHKSSQPILYDFVGFFQSRLHQLQIALWQHAHAHLFVTRRSLLHFSALARHAYLSQYDAADVLNRYFALPITVNAFSLRHYYLPKQEQSCLARHHHCLGATAMVGACVLAPHMAADIKVGPLNADAFSRMLPGSNGFCRLLTLVRQCLPMSIQVRVRLCLQRSAVPSLRLLTQDGAQKLGLTSWLCSDTATHDVDDLYCDLR